MLTSFGRIFALNIFSYKLTRELILLEKQDDNGFRECYFSILSSATGDKIVIFQERVTMMVWHFMETSKTYFFSY